MTKPRTNPTGALRRARGRQLAISAVVLVLAFLISPAASVAADPPESTTLQRVSAEVQPAVVYENVTFSTRVYDTLSRRWLYGGQRVSVDFHCTGFFVTPDGHAATAGHCVLWDSEMRSLFLDDAVKWAVTQGFYEGVFDETPTADEVTTIAYDDWELRERNVDISVSYGVAASGISQPQSRPARVLGSRAFNRGDVALIKIEGNDLPALELAPESDVSVGTPATAVGFPASVDDVTDASSFNPSFKEGSVSSIKTHGGGLLQVYEISAATSGGMSGGPTVDNEGRVIGVVSFGIRGETQPFNFIAPANLLTELMGDKGVENELGETNANYVAGLDAYFAGERDTAIEKLETVLESNPSHELAQEYLASAKALDQDAFAWLFVILGILVAALVAGGVAYLVVRRSRGGGAASAPAQAAPTPKAAAAAAPASSGLTSERPVIRAAPAGTGSTSGIAIVVENGPNEGQEIVITRDTSVGREGADVLIPDETASRKHARLRLVNGRLEVTDLGSSNGTEVNGTAITGPVELKNGDTITMGNTKLRVLQSAPTPGETVVAKPAV